MGNIDLDRLLNFLGYGSPTAPVVFVGMEEGLSPTPSLREQLEGRSQFDQIMDLRLSSGTHAERWFEGDSPPLQPTWNMMIRLLLARGGDESPEPGMMRRYQSRSLGASNGDNALLELMPLPAARMASWPYADVPEVAERFPTRARYVKKELPRRIELLRTQLSYGPELVVCYGSTYWHHFMNLFPAVLNWQQRGVFMRGSHGSLTVVLTPHFVARQMNGQREALIDLCKMPGRERPQKMFFSPTMAADEIAKIVAAQARKQFPPG